MRYVFQLSRPVQQAISLNYAKRNAIEVLFPILFYREAAQCGQLMA